MCSEKWNEKVVNENRESGEGNGRAKWREKLE